MATLNDVRAEFYDLQRNTANRFEAMAIECAELSKTISERDKEIERLTEMLKGKNV